MWFVLDMCRGKNETEGLEPRSGFPATSAPVSDSGSPIYLLADEARQARQAALASMVAALPPWPHITSGGTAGGRLCCLDGGGADLSRV